jgi:hypothetical protein
MTTDVVALCARPPDTGTVLAALAACGGQLRVATLEPYVQLLDDTGTVLVSIEGPRAVAPGEAQRLLGVPDAPEPAWWVETRAASAPPEAAVVARRFAAALLSVTGGTSWSSR